MFVNPDEKVPEDGKSIDCKNGVGDVGSSVQMTQASFFQKIRSLVHRIVAVVHSRIYVLACFLERPIDEVKLKEKIPVGPISFTSTSSTEKSSSILLILEDFDRFPQLLYKIQEKKREQNLPLRYQLYTTISPEVRTSLNGFSPIVCETVGEFISNESCWTFFIRFLECAYLTFSINKLKELSNHINSKNKGALFSKRDLIFKNLPSRDCQQVYKTLSFKWKRVGPTLEQCVDREAILESLQKYIAEQEALLLKTVELK